MKGIATVSAVAAVAATLGLAAGAPALAASHEVQQQRSVDIQDSDLRAFANATVEVRRISQSYTPQVQAAETVAEQDAVRQKAQGEMIDAIEKEGLTVQEYNQIGSAAQSNPAVADQIREYMGEQQ